MKKKLLSLALALILAIGITGHATVYADEATDASQAIATAEERQIGVDYSVTWTAGVDACWSKLTLNEKGIVEVDFTKPESNNLGLIDVAVVVFDKTGNCISFMMD